MVERLQRGPPWLRRQVTRIPERLQPAPKRTVRVQAYDDAGTLVHDVDVDTPDYHMVTGVREHDGRVWLGSLHEPAVAVVRPLRPRKLAAMGILESITTPRDLRGLSDDELTDARDRDPGLPGADLLAGPAATSAPTSASSS